MRLGNLALIAAFAALVPAAAIAGPVETFVEIPGGPGPLKGTMLTPVAGAGGPAVLMLVGSGPTDRNGNNPLGVSGSTYRLMAEGLAAQGVTSLRVDKRGMFASGLAAADPNAVTVADLAADAHAWAAKLKTETGAPCVWLEGHSEGALVALLAARDSTDLCGLILISAPGRRFSDALREQLKANPANAPLLDQALPAIDALEAEKPVDTTAMHPALLSLFRPNIQGFLIEMFKHDPAKLAAAYAGPILLLQGDSDIQVSVADAERLAAAQPNAKLVILSGVNHILKAGSRDRAETQANYADPSLPLAPGVVEAIADFIKAQPGTN
ncbi:MAG: alpha/beta hydrolase [Caulobacter sp.]|nr:alpha/beta hydrolase [Caulobacter sp.]